jgi:hypothetical protein
MSKFLNKKEQIYDIQLTPYGKYLLSIGSFKPTYYAFYDSNIIYDKRYTSTLSGTTPGMIEVPMEAQNLIDNRIKNETQYLGPLVMFTSPEYNEEILYEDDQYLTDISPTRIQPAPDVFRYVNAIGDATLMADSTQAVPSWKLVCLEGEITAIDPIDKINETKIPQIDIEAIYVKTVVEESYTNDPQGTMDIVGLVGPFSDGNHIQVSAQNLLFYGEEVNTQILMENFDVEVFEVTDNTGAKAVGQIALWDFGFTAIVPSDGDTVSISDGFRTVVFEWKAASSTATAPNITVTITAADNVVNAKALVTAINDSVLNIEATYAGTDGSRVYVSLVNKRLGVRANVPIIFSSDAYVDTNHTYGMSDGQDGTEVMKRKYFDLELPQIVDGYMRYGRPQENAAVTTSLMTNSTASVSYYFDYYRDDENDRRKLCKALEYYNKETYYINIEMDCNFNDTEHVYYDIYGSAVEPELCQD